MIACLAGSCFAELKSEDILSQSWTRARVDHYEPSGSCQGLFAESEPHHGVAIVVRPDKHTLIATYEGPVLNVNERGAIQGHFTTKERIERKEAALLTCGGALS